jgi:hypothetical protein
MRVRALILTFGMLLPCGAFAQTASQDPSATQACLPTGGVASGFRKCLRDWVSSCSEGRGQFEAHFCWLLLSSYWKDDAKKVGESLQQLASRWDEGVLVESIGRLLPQLSDDLSDDLKAMDEHWAKYRTTRCRLAEKISPDFGDPTSQRCSAELAFEQAIFYREQLALLRERMGDQ